MAGSLEHHDQGHPLLQGQLAEPVALVRRAAADRSAEHGHVLGAGQRRPALNAARTGHQRVARNGGILVRPHQLADLGERTGVEERGDPLAGVQATPFPLADKASLATHGERLRFPALDLLERRTPSAPVVARRQFRSVPSAASTDPPIPRRRPR